MGKNRLDGVPVGLTLADSQATDPFGRIRVSNPHTIFDSKQLYDKNPLFWSESTTNASGNALSSHSTTDASVSMYVEAGDTIIRQTKTHWNYQPAKGQLAFITGVITAGGTGVKARIGLFTATDGLFFEMSGTTMGVVRRKASADTRIAQADWNLDTMDGNGESGVTLDFSKAQIFVIDFEWLGVGRVRMGVVIDGVVYYVHEFVHANYVTAVYMSTPNLPVRYEISSAAGGDSATMQHICSSIISEGGRQDSGVIHSASTGATHVDADAANAIYAILGIRLKSTHLDALVKVIDVSIISETDDDFEWMVLVNPTIADTFTYANEGNSAVQVATGATANTVTADSEDIKTAGGYVNTAFRSGGSIDTGVQTTLHLGSTIAGVADEFVLCVRPLGASADIQGEMSWSESW